MTGAEKCEAKKTYTTRALAKKMAKHLLRTKGRRLKVYVCWHCRLYHLSKLTKQQMETAQRTRQKYDENGNPITTTDSQRPDELGNVQDLPVAPLA